MLKSGRRRNAIFMCVMGMQSLRIGLILVLEEGCSPLYLVKEPFLDSYEKFCYSISTFWFKNAKLSISKKKKKKKRLTLVFRILGRLKKGKQTSLFVPELILHRQFLFAHLALCGSKLSTAHFHPLFLQ